MSDSTTTAKEQDSTPFQKAWEMFRESADYQRLIANAAHRGLDSDDPLVTGCIRLAFEAGWSAGWQFGETIPKSE